VENPSTVKDQKTLSVYPLYWSYWIFS